MISTEIAIAFMIGALFGAWAARVRSSGHIRIYRELQPEGIEHGDEEGRAT